MSGEALPISGVSPEPGSLEAVAGGLDALAGQLQLAAEKLRELAGQVRELDECFKDWIEVAMRAGQQAAKQDVYGQYATELRVQLSLRLQEDLTVSTRQLFEEVQRRLCQFQCARCAWRDLRDWLACKSWDAQRAYDASAWFEGRACSEVLSLMAQIESKNPAQQTWSRI